MKEVNGQRPFVYTLTLSIHYVQDIQCWLKGKNFRTRSTGQNKGKSFLTKQFIFQKRLLVTNRIEIWHSVWFGQYSAMVANVTSVENIFPFGYLFSDLNRYHRVHMQRVYTTFFLYFHQ